MLARLALLFVVVPLIELVLLIQLGQWVGLWPTLGLVVLTGVAGAGLARAEGLRTWMAFQREVAQGRLPGEPLLDGLSVLVGGAFLLTPGLLTDVAGFSLLLPPTRRWIQRRVRTWMEGQVTSGAVRFQVWTPWSGPYASHDSDRADDVLELDPSKEIRSD
jgi:UPF0716 protein FxsA